MGELHYLGERISLARSALRRSGPLPPVDGAGVLLVQGFGMPLRTLRPLGRWLEDAGWRTLSAPLGRNTGCGEAMVERIAAVAAADAQEHGRPVTVVGHSRGGLLARVVAVRHPELVDRLVTVCTPWAIGPPDRPGVETVSRALRSLRRRGLRLMDSIECEDGPCCVRFRRDMHRTPEVPWTALWSSTDTIGGPAACPPKGPTSIVDLRTSHLGSVTSTAGWSAIAAALTADR